MINGHTIEYFVFSQTDKFQAKKQQQMIMGSKVRIPPSRNILLHSLSVSSAVLKLTDRPSKAVTKQWQHVLVLALFTRFFDNHVNKRLIIDGLFLVVLENKKMCHVTNIFSLVGAREMIEQFSCSSVLFFFYNHKSRVSGY